MVEGVILGGKNVKSGISNFIKPIPDSGNSNGPFEDELIRLNIEEMKRRRSGPTDNQLMELDGVNRANYSELVLSEIDCAGSSTNSCEAS